MMAGQKGSFTMNATRHGTTNFKMLRPYLNGMGPDGDSHRRFMAEGFMDLVAEYLFYSDYKGRPVYSLTHYGRQNGDAMRDPDMTVSVDWSAGSVEPLTFQNDYLGVYQEVYKRDESGQLLYSKRLRTDLDEFLWNWLHNIKEQGYSLKEKEQ
jgi:hypothetical protein|nr:MAG TPA: Protein of unknown function (DUF1249) [Caudoviricetes sp.]